MAKANVALALKSSLGTTAVTAACKIRSSGPAESMSAPRQDEAMPQLAASFDWTDWAARPETIYAHALTLLAAALVPRFKASIAILSEEHGFMPAAINESATTDDGTRGSAAAADSAAAGSIGGSGESTAGSTLLKSFGSILRSTASAATHRYETAPRPACNADLLRQAVSTATAAEALALLAAFASQHGGLTGLQCLPDLAGTAAAASRYNALPVVANALFAPGCTVRELVGSSKVQAVFAKLRDNMPADSGLHQEQWEADHDAAVAVLNSPQCTSERVALHCELKVVVGECGLLWHQMDEPRRILDAGVAMPTLCSIYGRPSAGLLATLEAAAMVGAVATVRRMLRAHSTELDAAAGAMDHERRQVQHALKVAVDRGHFPVVQELIAHASRMWTPDQLQLATSPLVLSAASAGYLNIVLLLCDTRNGPGLLRSGGETCNGSSSSSKSASTASLIAAAEAGHLDVLLALIRNGGADPKLPRLKDGTTALWAAAIHGRANVVAALLDDLPAEMRCDPNHQRFKDKTTALFIAAGQGHADVVAVLVAANADVAVTDAKSLTALHVAANQGYARIASMLLAAGANVNAVDVKQLTPLHSATWNGRVDVVKLLVDENADINAVCKFGTPLRLATKYNKPGAAAAAELLQQAGAVDADGPEMASNPKTKTKAKKRRQKQEK